MSDEAQKQPFWEELGLPAPGTPMSPEEYLQLPETTIPMEHLGGVVVYPHWNEETMSPAPVPDHQDIVLNIGTLLKAHAKQHGGSAHIAPVDVSFDNGVTVQPDVMWRSPDSQCARTDRRFHGPPELVVEVLSPSTGQRDKTDKFDIYEARGIREYWIVEPRDNVIEVYVLDGGAYRRLGAFKPGQTFDSPVLGQSVPVAEIFEQ
jgi:Uma2 family endonuclease